MYSLIPGFFPTQLSSGFLDRWLANLRNLQDDAPDVLHFVVSLLLFDGRDNEITFEIMNNEGAFPRLLELIHTRRGEEEAGLHRLLMELLYEMSRIQRVKLADLGTLFVRRRA